MGTTRLFRRSILALGLLAILVSYGAAADRSNADNGQSYNNAKADTPRGSALASAEEATLKRASRVMNAQVKSSDGQVVGRVDDLVLTPDFSGISYVAVSSGGILGIGSTLHAVPWTALSESGTKTYVISESGQEFKQRPGFKAGAWPSSADEDQTAAVTGNVKDRRFSHLKNSKVKTGPGRSAGDVRDLMIVKDTGRIAYTIVSYGGIAGIGSRYAAVPQGAITFDPARSIARLDSTPAALHANSFRPNQWPDLSNATVARQLDRTFGVQTSETALGYVPAEGGAVAAAPSARTPARSSGRSTTPPVSDTTPAAPSAAAAPPTPADLTGTFNASKITTIDGAVVDQGKFQATPSGSEMLWLRVRTTSGQTYLVNLGPRSYISSQDFYVVPGDQIHLSGSEVAATASGRQVFLPTEVTYNSHTLRLRSTEGNPLWEGRATTTEGQPPATPSPSSKPQTQSRAGTSGTGALGYTPAEEPGAAGAAAGQPMTPSGSGDLIALGALNLSTPRTIDGTVTVVGKTQAADGSDIIWMRVRTTDGQMVNVQVGPRDYVARKDFVVVAGDRVHLTGWDARSTGTPGATPIFVVSDVAQDGHVLQLRDRNGAPAWTSQPGLPGQTPRQPGAMEQAPRSGTSSQTAPGATNAQRTPRMGTEPNEPNQP